MSFSARANLDPAECLRLLGLPEAASTAQIKRAYRQLAQRFHPDKAGASEVDRQHFLRICAAYRCLMQTARLVEKGKSVGRCCVCREFGEAVMSLDGMTRCPTCALRPGSRLMLPMPPLVVAKCIGSIMFLCLAVALLVMGLRDASPRYAAAGAGAGAASVVLLVVACLRIVYCIQPSEQARLAAKRKTARRTVARVQDPGDVVLRRRGVEKVAGH